MKIEFNSKKELAEWNDRMVKKYHSQGTLFESKNPILRWIEKKRVKTIIELAGVSNEDRIIDIGCGEGYLLSCLPRTKQVVGLDISKLALNKARELLKEKNYIGLFFGDAQELPFTNNSFDKIICSELLEHVPNPKLVIKEMFRILIKSGRAVISVPDERQIHKIMRILKRAKLDKITYSPRKDENYEWHLHESNLEFVEKIIDGFFSISKIIKVPFILKYRFVIVLKPLVAISK